MDISADTTPARSSRLPVPVVGIKNVVIGTLLCSSPVTAIVVLGWQLRFMHAVTTRRLAGPDGDSLPVSRTNWLFGPNGSGWARRGFGGLWSNIVTGIGGFTALALATLPFTGLWLLSWWAGWENSFNKGYEQSWVGASLGLTGVAVSLIVMPHLPMALAHLAAERRWPALFEAGRIRRLVSLAGWRYVLFSILLILAALPVFAFRALPVFVEQIIPGLDTFTDDEISDLAGMLTLLKAAYVFLATVLFRGWSARIYAGAVLQAGAGRRPGRIGGMVWLAFLMVIWFGLVAQLYVGQFMNHNWMVWLNHPYLLLPWLA